MTMTKPTSEQVTFTASGSGATLRNLVDKVREVVSVKDFGAVGDGVTNDAAAFNAAWTARSPNPVLVPPGSYAITGTVTGEFYTFGTVTIVGGTVNTINRFTGAMQLDGSVFVVDATNNRVGINTASPAQALDVTGNALVSGTLGVTGATTLSSTLAVTGNTTLTGDLAVNGADITTTATGTATVFNANATTVNVGGAATAMAVGSQAAGTVSVNNLSMNAGYGSVAPAYGCRAWVNFNGTGAVAIRAAGNVGTITDNGTGDYTLNFASALPDTNYAVVGIAGNATAIAGVMPITLATSSVRINIRIGTNALTDCDPVCISVFR